MIDSAGGASWSGLHKMGVCGVRILDKLCVWESGSLGRTQNIHNIHSLSLTDMSRHRLYVTEILAIYDRHRLSITDTDCQIDSVNGRQKQSVFVFFWDRFDLPCFVAN